VAGGDGHGVSLSPFAPRKARDGPHRLLVGQGARTVSPLSRSERGLTSTAIHGVSVVRFMESRSSLVERKAGLSRSERGLTFEPGSGYPLNSNSDQASGRWARVASQDLSNCQLADQVLRDDPDGENARDLSKRRRGVGRAKSPISWFFASADAVEISGGQRSQSALVRSCFCKGALYYILEGYCARGFPTVACGPSGNRSGRSGHHRVSTGANLDAPGVGKPIGPVEFSPATGRHRVVRPIGDRTDPFRDWAELLSSLDDR
jgi:hypothetical protein